MQRAYGNNVSNTIEQLQAMAGSNDILKLTVE